MSYQMGKRVKLKGYEWKCGREKTGRGDVDPSLVEIFWDR